MNVIVTQMAKNFSAIYGNKIFTRTHQWPLSLIQTLFI